MMRSLRLLNENQLFIWVSGRKNKWNALKNLDVVLLPSPCGEDMPIAMIEAMAVGCLVIVTDIAYVK